MTMISEQHVKMAAKLYEARDTMRAFHAGQYSAKIREYLPFVNAAMQREGLDVLPAAISVMKQLNERGSGSGMDQLLVMALAVEMTEGELALPAVGSVIEYRCEPKGRPYAAVQGRAEVRQHISPAKTPAHLRMSERMIFVVPIDAAGKRGAVTMIRASEILTPPPTR